MKNINIVLTLLLAGALFLLTYPDWDHLDVPLWFKILTRMLNAGFIAVFIAIIVIKFHTWFEDHTKKD